MGKSLLFGSELKALRPHPDWRGDLNRDALATYLRHSYIPTPASIYQNIHKLPPGTLLRFSADNPPGILQEPTVFWSLQAVAEAGQAKPFTGSDDEAVEQLDTLLRDAVRRQMIADVPLGAFLSGGIDSSTIVALMQAQSNRPVRTFSIGFHEDAYNESLYARAIARHLGTDHTELMVGSQDALRIIPQLPAIWDEPFADSSQIPTYLLAHMTREHVTVSLSGDAGDELFAGYRRYFYMLDKVRAFGRVPGWMQQAMSHLSPHLLGRVGYGFGRLGVGPLARLFSRASTFTRYLPFELTEMYRDVPLSHWLRTSDLVPGAQEVPTAITDRSRWADVSGPLRRMTTLDLISYLPDDILVKVDRASMAVSLESRIPLLDHRVVEFSQRLPDAQKIRHKEGKWILRQVLYKYIPRQLTERPKMGFGVPIDSWLRGDLRDWAEALIDERKLRQEGIFNVDMVRSCWNEHVSGRNDNHYPLWDVLMFQAWRDTV